MDSVKKKKSLLLEETSFFLFSITRRSGSFFNNNLFQNDFGLNARWLIWGAFKKLNTKQRLWRFYLLWNATLWIHNIQLNNFDTTSITCIRIELNWRAIVIVTSSVCCFTYIGLFTSQGQSKQHNDHADGCVIIRVHGKLTHCGGCHAVWALTVVTACTTFCFANTLLEFFDNCFLRVDIIW